jgi:tetratricopeptide (TPR) repeat protein
MTVKAPSAACMALALAIVLAALAVDGRAAAKPPAQTELTQAFLAGINSYRKGDYAEAADDFLKIATAGVVNARLYYNLANAYLKCGELGRAVLWYERALKLAPGDPDLQFNYAYANSLLEDEAGENASIWRILFFWKYQMSQNAVLWTATALNALFWILLGLRVLRRKRPFNAAVTVLLAVTIVFVATVGYNFFEAAHPRRGVVLAGSLSVRSGVTPEATELFVLHAGTRVRVEAENGSFVRIYYAPGKIGWVRKDEIGII